MKRLSILHKVKQYEKYIQNEQISKLNIPTLKINK